MTRVSRSWRLYCCFLVFAPVAAWAAEIDVATEPTRSGGIRDSESAASGTAWVALAGDESFRPISPEQIERGRQRLVKAAQDLTRFLSYGSAENSVAWKEYLKWDELQQQLRADTDSDPNKLGALIARFYTGAPGLELPPFVSLREAILGHRRLILAAAGDDVSRLYREQLAAIEADLRNGATTSGGPLVDLAARLDWLEQLGQAPELVAGVRQQFGNANLRVSAAEATVSRGFSEPVSQTSPINEMILGTHVCGTAHTVGAVNVRLIPDDNRAVLAVSLTGVSNSDTVGRQSPVRIYSRGVTQIFSRKRLFIDELGVRGEPATARCSTDNHIFRIRSESAFASHLIEKVAWKRARQQGQRAERISARRAERRVAAMMDRQTRDRMDAANAQLETKVRRPLRQRNIYPRDLRFWTTDQRLHMEAVQGRTNQLAAPSAPREITPHQVVAHLHESLILNSAVNAIGGLTVTDERAQQLVKDVTGEVPEQLRIKQDEDPWSITFDMQRPLLITFDNDQVMIAIRGRRFVRGNQEVRQITQIAATYQLSIDSGRAKLTRVGDVEVTYPDHDGDRLSLAELRNKTFMMNKFEGLFKQELGGEGIRLSDRWETLIELSLEHISARDGWLSLGWN